MGSIGIGSRWNAAVWALPLIPLLWLPGRAGAAQEQGQGVVGKAALTATHSEFVLEEATGRDVPEAEPRQHDAAGLLSPFGRPLPERVEGGPSEALSGTWGPLSSGTTNMLWGLDTLSSTNVWTVGVNSTVLHSTDGGGAWVPSATGIGSGRELDSVDFVDTTYGWIIGPNTIARTEDGGANWRYWTSSPSAVSLYSGTAVSSSVAWGVGVSYNSTYGWCTMISRFTYTGSLSVYQLAWCPGNAYIGISMVDADLGWTVGALGMVRKITGGTASPPTTVTQTSGTTSSLRAVRAIDANTVYAVGFNGTIIKTTNGGATWGTQNSGTTQTLWNISCASATECLVTGSAGTVLGTDDGGATWTPESSGTTADLANVAFPSLSTGYAVGAGGVILKRVPPCSYSLAPTSAHVGAGGGSDTVAVTAPAGCAWTAVSNDPWITVTGGASGTGDGTVSYSVAANAAGARNGSMTIATLQFPVDQDPAACSYSIDPTSVLVPAEGAIGTVTVTTGSWCSWTAASNDAWITVTGGSSGTGSGTVSYSVGVNAAGARTGSVRIGDATAVATFTVEQAAAACTYSIDPTSVTAPPRGSTGTVAVTTESWCNWVAACTDDWITITDGSSGTGDGTVSYSVTVNPGPARTGSCTIADKPFTVNQAEALLSASALVLTPLSQGVLKLADTVEVQPTWTNDGALPTGDMTGTGTASNGGTLADDVASYGVIDAGAAASCAATSDCYSLTVDGPRPASHWDITLVETLSEPASHEWRLHVGDSFTDVPRTSGTFRFVETLLHKGVTGGCTATTYCPGTSATRGQMAIFALVGKEGSSYSPVACGTTPMFTDVPVTSPLCKWIEEVARRGIAGGCTATAYCPGAVVTRGQMPIFMLKTLDPAMSPPACTTPMFGDVPASSPLCRWIEELARRGVVSGCGSGNYCPASPVTRGQMAVFISGTFGLTLYGP